MSALQSVFNDENQADLNRIKHKKEQSGSQTESAHAYSSSMSEPSRQEMLDR
jgi:hypothetical protein